MFNSKLVSVIIPTYNVEKYIEKSIDSILNQTYSNIEIIIVDDCSTDRTYNILKKISKKDNRIKLFRNNKNLKICKTLNKAWIESKGLYIVRMDGDDISELDRIEKQINFLELNKNIGIVGTSVKNINEEDMIFSEVKYYSDFEKLKKLFEYGTPVLHIWAARREVYEELKGYRDILYVEDYDFLLRAVTKGYKISNLENYYGYYVRYRGGNTATTNGVEQEKSFEYTKNLFLERIKRKDNLDSFNENEYLNIIKTNNIEKEKYFKSQKKLEKIFIEKNIVKKVFLLLYSILLSKYQFKKIKRRILYKIYGKKK